MWVFRLFCILSFALTIGGAAKANEEAPMTVEREIIANDLAWAKAEVAGDMARIDQLLHKDFLFNRNSGPINKASLMEGISKMQLVDQTTSDQTVIVKGDMAVLMSTCHWFNPNDAGEIVETQRYRYTSTWVHEDGRWQVIAIHMVGVPME